MQQFLLLNIYQWQNNNSVIESYEVKNDSLVSAKMDVEKELEKPIRS
ncbi:MAG: hypothetical protein IPP71_14205 [Bacteroidetes bacterium]|nr:hypothetical protein [Bacteroidota bacterium]